MSIFRPLTCSSGSIGPVPFGSCHFLAITDRFECWCVLQMSSDDEVREEKELDLSSNDVVTKYKAAAEILNSK